MRLPSVMKHNFSMLPSTNIKRSRFNRSFGLKTTINAGGLYPIFVDEVLPGDTFQCSPTIFARMATLRVPFMDNVFLESFFFYVPTRLLWEHWENFCGHRDNPDDDTDYLIPSQRTGGNLSGTLQDYMGLPIVEGVDYNVLPLRAYWLVWNEWFRDENLQDSVPVSTDDSSDIWVENAGVEPEVNGLHSYFIAPRGKRHDYFTSALPWPQKGPGVELPLVGNAPVYSIADSNYFKLYDSGQGQWGYVNGTTNVESHGQEIVMFGSYNDGEKHRTQLPKEGSPLIADLSDVAGATINSLRQAFQLQKFYERDARGGTRYTEILRSHFGVISPDARLQRPEYLGGGSSRIYVNPVAQQSASDDTTPQANLAAYATAVNSRHGFSKSFVEHGYVIGLVNIRADLNYQQGLDRMWSRQTREDFYWPTFAHLGEQPIYNKEIYAQGTSVDNEVFGYIPRYDEYRFKNSQITGRMRSTVSNSLDVWHLAQKFDNLPTLSSEFIVDNPPIDRVLAVESSDLTPQFYLDVYFKYYCTRPMPAYGTPGLIDHF